jgi:hypothetical protein
MKDLVRKFPKLEEEMAKAYDILSKAGFELLIEDGIMQAWPKRLHIENDMEEGFVIIDDDYRDEFEERQEELRYEEEEEEDEDEENVSIEYYTEYHTDEETGITVPVQVTVINR